MRTLSNGASDKRAAAILRRPFNSANSLSLKIFPLTPLDSIFWQIKPTPGPPNPNESKMLPITTEKKLRAYFAPWSPANVPPCPLRSLWFIFKLANENYRPCPPAVPDATRTEEVCRRTSEVEGAVRSRSQVAARGRAHELDG